MKNSTIFSISALLAISFIMAGCLFTVPTDDQLGKTDVSVPQYNNPQDYICMAPNDGNPPCWCMFCENVVPWQKYVPLLSLWYDSSLYGGKCTFDYCDQEIYEQKIKSTDSQPKAVMFGSGPSFVSADSANRYCKYSLQIATKWLKPTADGLPPRPPSRNRAQCWLERNTLPLYIYYGNTPNIDMAATQAIADRLDEGNVPLPSTLGPAMITTEVTLDSADASMLAKVRQQIRTIRQSCEDCFLILAIKSGDNGKEALRQIFRDPSNPEQFTPEYAMVDAVGFGFRANDYKDCSVENVVGDNYLFSRQILKEYSKPTIWLYAGASEGNNIDGSCTWDSSMVHRFYENIFALAQGMASSGIIGVSFYEWTDGTGPLACAPGEGCNFGLILANGEQKHPELNTWSRLCQYYGSGGEDSATSFRSPLIFSRNSYGTACDFYQNNKMYDVVSQEVNDPGALVYDPVQQADKVPHLGCGEVCPSDNAMTRTSIYDEQPGFQSFEAAHCELFPQIEDFSDDLDISAIYYRAIVEQESSYDPLIASCVDTSNSGCNAQGKSLSQICADAGMTGCHTSSGASECPAGQKPCAFGLAQCIELPGDPTYTAKCGGGSSYNPFDPGMSICCGTNKFSDNVEAAQSWVRTPSNWAVLSKCLPDGARAEEADWIAYYLASNRYYGAPSFGTYHGSNLLAEFSSQLDQNGACTGEQHYIRWLQQRNPSTAYYGAQIMSRYREAVDQCSSDCPN